MGGTLMPFRKIEFELLRRRYNSKFDPCVMPARLCEGRARLALRRPDRQSPKLNGVGDDGAQTFVKHARCVIAACNLEVHRRAAELRGVGLHGRDKGSANSPPTPVSGDAQIAQPQTLLARVRLKSPA